MASLKEITYNIKNIVEGGRSTQDSPFSLRQIAFFVVYYRALLIRRETDYFKNIDGLDQSLGLIPMEVTEQSVGKAGEMPSAVLRTAHTLPQPVRMRTRTPFTFIGSPDFEETYPISTTGQVRYQSYNKYTSDRPRSYYQNDRIYITSDKVADMVNEVTGGKSLSEIDTSVVEESITTIRVNAVLDDPIKGWKFKNDEPYDWEDELPGMPEDMIQRITQSLLNGEASAIVQSVLDTDTDNLPVNQEQNAAQQ